MKPIILRKKWSTFGGFAIWGTAAFMAQPTVASFVAHFVLLPLLIVATLWIAHHEATS